MLLTISFMRRHHHTMRLGMHSNLTGLCLLLAAACGAELPGEEAVDLSTHAAHLDSCSPDVTPPSVMCQPEGGLRECIAYGYIVHDFDLVTASDNCGITFSSHSLGNLGGVGSTSTSVGYSDAAGNSAGCSSQWSVVDSSPPTVTLNGQLQIVLAYGASYVDAGAYSSDICDGSLDRRMSRSGGFSTSVPGIYPITYSVADSVGHVTQRTRLVTVLPQTDCTAQLAAPVLMLQGRHEETLECGRNTWSEPGALAADECGAVSVHTYNSGQDPYGPGPNSNAEGRYTVQYLAWNGQGTTSTDRTVIVKDTLPPILRLKGPMRMTHTCGSAWVDPGVKATDSCYGDVSSSVQTTGSVNGWAEGTYTVTYQARDPGGHLSNIQNRVVEVVDCPW